MLARQMSLVNRTEDMSCFVMASIAKAATISLRSCYASAAIGSEGPGS